MPKPKPKRVIRKPNLIGKAAQVPICSWFDNPAIVVKFRDSVKLPYIDGLEKYLKERRIGDWGAVRERAPRATFRRLYRTLKPGQIKEIVARAVQRDSSYKPPNLLNYFVLIGQTRAQEGRVVEVLLSWEIVQTAYIAPHAVEPAVNFQNNPRSPYQRYLEAAPEGIDAKYAWRQQGGDGAGQEVIDLEGGWTLDHEDLIDHGAKTLYGQIIDASCAHGTRVLGVICATDNRKGGVGIAPNVQSVNAVSHSGDATNIPEAILAAVQALPFGGVLALEAAAYWTKLALELPVETDRAVFDNVRLATAAGIAVVEAAGNWNKDLDDEDLAGFVDGDGKSMLYRDSRNFSDSGAILVGSAWARQPVAGAVTPWSRRPDSNYGSRIDCFGWGENVDTADSKTDPATGYPTTADYTFTFDGTSSATAIVAGAALSVQGMAKLSATFGARLSPKDLRRVLSDKTNGNTPTLNPPADKIGVMPNLAAIGTNVLELPLPQPGDSIVAPS